MPDNNRDYALVVGIEHYPDFRDLKGAVGDANDFAAWLTDTQFGGGLPESNCKTVLSTLASRTPVQDDIDDKLLEILTAVGSGRGRRFYLFFSGHGLARSNVDTDLCAATWSERRRNMALDSQYYLKALMKSGKFEEVVFFFDCCRVRLVSAIGRISVLDFPMPSNLAGTCHSFLANATEFQNSAFEAEVSDSLDPNGPLVRGHFTRALLAALRGGAADSSGGVRVSRLKEYLEAETPRIALSAGHQQRPEIVNGFPSNPEPVFGAALPVANVEIVFTPERRGPIVLVKPDNSELRREDATGSWRLTLSPGLHLLTDTATNTEQCLRFLPTQEVFHVHF